MDSKIKTSMAVLVLSAFMSVPTVGLAQVQFTDPSDTTYTLSLAEQKKRTQAPQAGDGSVQSKQFAEESGSPKDQSGGQGSGDSGKDGGGNSGKD